MTSHPPEYTQNWLTVGGCRVGWLVDEKVSRCFGDVNEDNRFRDKGGM